MGDGISGISSRSREPTCDESTGVCGARTEDPQVSRAGDVEDFYPPPPKIDAAKNAEIARNMAAANTTTKLDELTWTALRKRIADLEASKSDPAQLAACKHELQRRQGIAAEQAGNVTTTNYGSTASGDVDRKNGVANGKIVLGTNRTGSIEVGSFGASAGTNTEANAAAVRYTHQWSSAGTTTVEAGSAKASIGSLNSDGSKGFHVALQANGVSVEHTKTTKEGASVTVGASAGDGFELSFGFKGDGMCVRVGAGPITVGGCTGAPGQQATWSGK